MKKHKAKELISKYVHGEPTPEERALVEQWFLKDFESNDFTPGQDRIAEADQRMRVHLMNHIGLPPVEAKTIRLWPRVAAAASILLVLSVTGYFLWHKHPNEQAVFYTADIKPGGNKAILTLSNGKQVNLTDAQNGIVAKEAHESIKKANDGTLSYEGQAASGDNQQVTYNTVTTPRGGQWPLILPDGTKVMLDAASSIRYPVSFNGSERRVEITGQAYFEVAHNAKPFKVGVKGETIEDLGTHFNINAYDDEQVIKTTLLEGGVKVSKGNQAVILKPGQQSITQSINNSITIQDADVEEAVAWKNGLFSFKHSDMQTIMRQLSRWYDVEVSYEGKIPQRLFSGDIHRNLKASQVLDALSYYKVHFVISGKKIIVKE